MDSLETLTKTALEGFFQLLERHEDYLKTRQLINSSVGVPLPETLGKLNLLERKFETDYKAFNKKHSQLIELIKKNPTKAVTLSVNKGLPSEGNFSIELDKDNNLTVKKVV